MSKHLDKIVALDGIVPTQVVFVDVEKCSRRKTGVRGSVVKTFNALVNDCLNEVVTHYAKTFEVEPGDVVKSQAGDSVALMFTFPGVNDAHFRFAKLFIEKLNQRYKSKRCDVFDDKRWCNCCPDLFYVRIGMDEGPAQVFRDINQCYNVIGTVVDMAFRIMNLGDGSQILMSDSAYRHIVDLETSSDLEENNRPFRSVSVKHEVVVDVFQYTGKVDGLCTEVPVQLARRKSSVEELMNGA